MVPASPLGWLLWSSGCRLITPIARGPVSDLSETLTTVQSVWYFTGCCVICLSSNGLLPKALCSCTPGELAPVPCLSTRFPRAAYITPGWVYLVGGPKAEPLVHNCSGLSFSLCNRSRESSRAGFMILNRLNSDNAQEDIVPGMEFRLQPPFILYGKESGGCDLYCIGGWWWVFVGWVCASYIENRRWEVT